MGNLSADGKQHSPPTVVFYQSCLRFSINYKAFTFPI